jgi:hypothetical protein
MGKYGIVLSGIFFLLISCSSEPTQIKFIESKNNISRFEIKNNSDFDIESLSIEIEFIDRKGKVLLTDTFTYQVTRNISLGILPFLKAGDETFIVQSNPVEMHKVNARIIDVKYLQ